MTEPIRYFTFPGGKGSSWRGIVEVRWDDGRRGHYASIGDFKLACGVDRIELDTTIRGKWTPSKRAQQIALTDGADELGAIERTLDEMWERLEWALDELRARLDRHETRARLNAGDGASQPPRRALTAEELKAIGRDVHEDYLEAVEEAKAIGQELDEASRERARRK